MIVDFVQCDTNEDTFILTFSELMSTTFLLPEFITFHSSSCGGSSYNLTGFRNVTGRDRNIQLVILLAVTDERALRFNPLIVKHQVSTYISLTEGAFSDFAENSVESTG